MATADNIDITSVKPSDVSSEIASAAMSIATSLSGGATMWCVAPRWPAHAQHLAVEFVHPVIVGKKALPAVHLDGPDVVEALRVTAAADDVVVIVGRDADLPAGLVASVRNRALMTVRVGWGSDPVSTDAHFTLWVGESDAAPHDGSVVRAYHLLWELVHVCLEHLPAAADGTVASATDFLYPFQAEGGAAADVPALLDDLARSAGSKIQASQALALESVAACREELDVAARQISSRVSAGGRLLIMGNGGSATDARSMVDLFVSPPSGAPSSARPLLDSAVVTALANDIGVDSIFSRQLAAYAKPADVAVGFSTSGDSANVIEGFAEATSRGLLTIGFSGYEGGRMASLKALDHCFIVDSDSVHRVQEAQNAMAYTLWESTITHRNAADA